MLKSLTMSLFAATLCLQSLPVRAESCPGESRCILRSVQFVPGEEVTVEMVNLTDGLLEVQQPSGTDPFAVSPGQVIHFIRGGRTDRNFSVVFWDSLGISLKVNVQKTDTETLRIEVNPGGRPPGDRTIYLRNDGRLEVF